MQSLLRKCESDSKTIEEDFNLFEGIEIIPVAYCSISSPLSSLQFTQGEKTNNSIFWNVFTIHTGWAKPKVVQT